MDTAGDPTMHKATPGQLKYSEQGFAPARNELPTCCAVPCCTTYTAGTLPAPGPSKEMPNG